MHEHHGYAPALDFGDRLLHVGVPIMPMGSTTPRDQGLGGSARVAAAAAPLNARFAGDLSFFVWLVIIGVIIPGLIVGGLKAGGFQFVFRGR